jgi:hypothetical protein
MKPKLIPGLALVLSAMMFGCSAFDHRSANSKPSTPDLYLHLFASFVYPEQPRLIVSAPIPRSGDFDISMDDNQHLKGRIELRNGIIFLHFQGGLGDGTNVFDGEVELEKRYEPWPQPYDEKAPFICQPHFVLSSNPSPESCLKEQAAAEKKYWERENPLTARQLAEVKRKFHLMRPGMTQDEVFAMLGLSGYQNRLLPIPFFNSNDSNIGDYQLSDEEHLMLFFDNTGMKTKKYQLADGEKVELLDYTSDTSHRLVIKAELHTVTRSGNASPVLRTTLRWP